MSSKNSILRGFKDIYKLKKGAIPLLIFQNIINSVVPFINIFFPAQIVDSLSERNIKKTVWLIIAATILNALLFFLSSWINKINDGYIDFFWAYEQNSISKKLYEVDYKYLENSSFMTKIEQHVDDVKTSMGIYSTLIYLIRTFTAITTKLIISLLLLIPFLKVIFIRTGNSFWESPWLALSILLSIIGFVIIFLPITNKLNKKINSIRKEYLKIYHIFGYYCDLLSNYKTGKEIRVFKEQKIITNQATKEMLERGNILEKKRGALLAFNSGTMTFYMSLIGFSIYLIIGLKAFAGLYSIGNIVCYIGSCFQIINAISEVVGVFGKLTNLKPRIELYYEIIDTQSREKTRKNLPCYTTNRIEFKNVYFKYEKNGPYVIDNLNFVINPGEKIAIVGENGSGKTTFIKLLCGLLRPTRGEILINNKNIETYDIEEYSKIFSVVFQDFEIFSLPLGENIAVSQNINYETAINCLNRIGFESPLGLEQYLYKDCEKTGIEISGGEAQKIAMARALYKDAPFIILDEPTAALDPFAEFEIYSNFNELTQNKTVIYISHRLSSCAFCDKIIVFEKGQITQAGTHRDLIQNAQGKYYELWNSQAQYYL